MKLGKDYFEEKKSSFLSMDKDLAIITQKIMKNQDLLKMLYYTQPDCLKGQDLSFQQIQNMLHKQIKIIPKVVIDQTCPNYIIITFDRFQPNDKNPEFRDCELEFSILCHPDHWNMNNFALRPYKIAGELDHMFNNQKMTGIGTLEFVNGTNLVLNDQLMGLVLTYKAIHGIEDQINPLS